MGPSPTMTYLSFTGRRYISLSVADPDPGSGAFLTSGPPEKTYSGSRIPNPFLESIVTNFWVKSSIILGKLGQSFFFGIKKKI